MTDSQNLSLLDALFLGALQGVGEFLPISSSGHLALAQYALGRTGDALRFFDVALHVGTLAAVLWRYRRQLSGADPGDDRDFPDLGARPRLLSLAFWLIVALLPAVAAKLAFRETKPGAEPTWRSRIGDLRERASENPRVVLAFLACSGCVMALASRAKSGVRGVKQMSWKYALAVGCAQAASALCPGLSRSGMTIATALALGFRAPWAVNFSLLLSAPTVLAALVWEARTLSASWLVENALAVAVGVAVSAVVGWWSIALLARCAIRNRWVYFAAYLWLVAGIGWWLLAMRA